MKYLYLLPILLAGCTGLGNYQPDHLQTASPAMLCDLAMNDNAWREDRIAAQDMAERRHIDCRRYVVYRRPVDQSSGVIGLQLLQMSQPQVMAAPTMSTSCFARDGLGGTWSTCR